MCDNCETDANVQSLLTPEQKSKWLAALRSGDYAKGKDRLRSADGTYCCLGVLCDVLKDEVNEDWEPKWSSFSFGIDSYGFLATAGLSAKMVELTGISTLGKFNHSTKVDSMTPYASLSEMNDNGHMTFNEIADFIEKYF